MRPFASSLIVVVEPAKIISRNVAAKAFSESAPSSTRIKCSGRMASVQGLLIGASLSALACATSVWPPRRVLNSPRVSCNLLTRMASIKLFLPRKRATATFAGRS